MLFAILTFLFGEGDMQKGYLNLNFLIGFGLEKIATDAVNLEQLVPLIVNGPYFNAPIF